MGITEFILLQIIALLLLDYFFQTGKSAERKTHKRFRKDGLIAAKSILRYRSDETLKSEYVLIGTLLSFGIAVIAGIVVNIL